jgi:hypothetical protein
MNNAQINKALPIIRRQEKALAQSIENAKANTKTSLFRFGRVVMAITGGKSLTATKKKKHGLSGIDRRRISDAKKFFLLCTSKDTPAEFFDMLHSRNHKSGIGILRKFEEKQREEKKKSKGDTSKGDTSKGDSTPELSEALPEGMTAIEMSAFVAAWCEKNDVPVADVFRPLLGEKTMLKMAMVPTKKAA